MGEDHFYNGLYGLIGLELVSMCGSLISNQNLDWFQEGFAKLILFLAGRSHVQSMALRQTSLVDEYKPQFELFTTLLRDMLEELLKGHPLMGLQRKLRWKYGYLGMKI